MAGFSRHLRYARFGNCIPQVTIFNIYYTLLKGTCLSCYYHKKKQTRKAHWHSSAAFWLAVTADLVNK